MIEALHCSAHAIYIYERFEEEMNDSTKTQIWRCGQKLLTFECPLEWTHLEKTDDPTIRFCQKCSENVHLCESPDEFASHAKMKNCVAIPANLSIPGSSQLTKPILGRPAPWSYELAGDAKSFWKHLEQHHGSLSTQLSKEFERLKIRCEMRSHAFTNVIAQLLSHGLKTGEFRLQTGSDWSDEQIKAAFNQARGGSAKGCFGIYIIYGLDAQGETPIYVGLSGTIKNDGTIRKQSLHERLGKKQDGQLRPLYFHELIHKGKQNCGPWPNGLRFSWIETYREITGTPPFLAESQLLAAYLSDFGRLPPLNNEA